MPDGLKRRDLDPELARARLTQALDSCRFVVSNYRAMLGGRVLAENHPHDSNQSGPPPNAA